ncbi:Glycine--tRNA ligase beta subunit [uncultured Desulfobacterium sp.]|uniref:Glycine--tRNA ligase beta subunit n=1 Tax=uncultured Desulfobacterium sp. TaxID=201089 RepID=A0A445N085_9BACT|nr:Glycine--tRNA ligase beta subunit [uncultured Desulfobacterium sp.]
MVAEFLLEIGTEEIPSGYLADGLKALRQFAQGCLEENRIEIAGGIYSFGTPRRLVLIGKAIAERQEDLVHEVTGPPKNVAYDKEGRPTKAAIGFATRQGIAVEELTCIETPKGEYLFAKTKIPGRPTRDILAEALPQILSKIPWPKSMRWGAINTLFVRPVHWVLAIINGEVIPFEFGGVQTGNVTWGHRFMAPDPVQIYSVQGYFQAMKESFVLVDQKEREEVAQKAAGLAASAVGGVPVEDVELTATVANLVEYPSAVCGDFDKEFLNLPDPVLITVMKKHQRYFAVYDSDLRLMPNFVAINNTVARDESVVKKGHERVLRARLSDAAFFFREDLKRPLAERIEDLKGVIYQADLGTSFAKIQRSGGLAEYLAQLFIPEKIEDVKTASLLCKCDLVTHMVTEFPELQGVMGKEYARMEGYPEEVCNAVHEHYLPERAGGVLPSSAVGAVLGLADRMDTITGCFAVGLIPTGNTDPFALRRHALAIVHILEERGWDLSLTAFIDKAVSILGGDVRFDADRVSKGVLEFFRERFRNMLIRSGYESDPIEAVISVSFDRICGLRRRIDQLKKFASESAEFQTLTLTFKRVSNILKKQQQSFDVSPVLFREDCETSLWDAYQTVKDDVYNCMENARYFDAYNLLAGLRRPVDEFFDGVEVLTKSDDQLRQNRVGLLQNLSGLFLGVADFSKFSV